MGGRDGPASILHNSGEPSHWVRDLALMNSFLTTAYRNPQGETTFYLYYHYYLGRFLVLVHDCEMIAIESVDVFVQGMERTLHRAI